MESNTIYNDYGMKMGFVIHEEVDNTYTVFIGQNIKTYTKKDFNDFLDGLDWFVNQNTWVNKDYLFN